MTNTDLSQELRANKDRNQELVLRVIDKTNVVVDSYERIKMSQRDVDALLIQAALQRYLRCVMR